jgi:hypothetical protein
MGNKAQIRKRIRGEKQKRQAVPMFRDTSMVQTTPLLSYPLLNDGLSFSATMWSFFIG